VKRLDFLQKAIKVQISQVSCSSDLEGRELWYLPINFFLRFGLYKLDDDAEMYDIYLGIKFLWAENGPLALLGDLPSPEAQGEEGSAARLKEADLKHCPSLYNKYTH
jgi:hypothetical protein